jgi:hypothetical protein
MESWTGFADKRRGEERVAGGGWYFEREPFPLEVEPSAGSLNRPMTLFRFFIDNPDAKSG